MAGDASQSTACHVLIVDGYRDAADMLAAVLRCDGYEVDVAYDAAAAIAKVHEHQPDVVLCELRMPGPNGQDLVPALRSRLTRARLIAVSAYARAEDVQAARDGGCDAHVAKPAPPEVIERLFG